ncbi:vgr related protein [Sphingomonas mollis]|uniref:Vgr related protein n=1 Tax=Sphingomonas mollis TaxID=2795726 RepID=A0ABS0XNA1_9SPHN|nr:vgr related protein [Sphingomonas sp. BT553]MBJ6121509.1 vgr related protein [Sphingomonas sp. BT553]
MAPGAARRLTPGEIALARSVYGDRIDLTGVEIRRRKWAFFQPRQVAMAPCGHIHFHPHGDGWSDDFAEADIDRRGLFVHELAHVWQWQRGIYLPLARAPFCRYSYTIKPGWPLVRYGLEQQAEIIRHAYLLREGEEVPGAPALEVYESLLRGFR